MKYLYAVIMILGLLIVWFQIRLANLEYKVFNQYENHVLGYFQDSTAELRAKAGLEPMPKNMYEYTNKSKILLPK